MVTNDVNSVWNLLYNGCRVPVNDTDLDGAPAALGSHEPEWADGSLNKAVYETAKVQGIVIDPEDVEDAIAGVMDPIQLKKYVNSDQLYGYKEDARGIVPGSMISFRGYPAPVFLSSHLETVLPYSVYEWYPNGAFGDGTVGSFIILASWAELTYKLPYDIIYDNFFKVGTTDLYSYEFKIAAGNLTTTHYRVQGDLSWIPLPQGKIFYSIESSTFDGDKTFTVTAWQVYVDYYYGSLTQVFLTIPYSEYHPAAPIIAQSVGSAYKNPKIYDIDCYLSSCTELNEFDLFKYSDIPIMLYKIPSDDWVVGTVIYTEQSAVTRATSGKYVWAAWVYNSLEYGPIYSLSRYIELNSTGVIVRIDNNIQSIGGGHCYTGDCV